MSDRSERIKQYAETVTEKLLAWAISLPPPFTFVVTVGALALAWAVGKFA